MQKASGTELGQDKGSGLILVGGSWRPWRGENSGAGLEVPMLLYQAQRKMGLTGSEATR